MDVDGYQLYQIGREWILCWRILWTYRELTLLQEQLPVLHSGDSMVPEKILGVNDSEGTMTIRIWLYIHWDLRTWYQVILWNPESLHHPVPHDQIHPNPNHPESLVIDLLHDYGNISLSKVDSLSRHMVSVSFVFWDVVSMALRGAA